MKHSGSLRPDLQWPELRTLVEYLGDEGHASHDARVEDKNRMQDYVSSGYKPFFLMFDDVKSVSALNRTAMMLAHEFAKNGKKFEPYRLQRLFKDEEFAHRQAVLVSRMLPPVTRYS
ncbi:MAG: hypothetical protein Q4A07_01610 [Coriobacteriales bacterium]|nr:hypothetical protein [Coriobacteriales bacterium]